MIVLSDFLTADERFLAMSTSTPTLVPRRPIVPNLLPRVPQVFPCSTPHPSFAQSRLLSHRDILREMEDLSEEEAELDEIITEQSKRGFSWYVPIGRHFTLQEEKADEQADDEEDDESQSAHSNMADSPVEDEGEAPDLDAEMEDMDEAPPTDQSFPGDEDFGEDESDS